MMDGWMVGPSPTRCWLRPDADDDDDADANERNMRRHPPLPPPLLAPRPPSPPPLARYRLSSRPSRSPERIRRLRGEQGARKGTNENRTIYPADYSPPPRGDTVQDPRSTPEAGPTTRIRRQDFAKVCGGSLSIRFLVALPRVTRSNAKVYRSRFDPSTRKTLYGIYIYIYICIA